MAAAVAVAGAASSVSSWNPTRTMSRSESEGCAGNINIGSGIVETEELSIVVAHLEALQEQQRSHQQPNSEIDSLLERVLHGHPEWRPRMAVMAKSAALRKKILTAKQPGCRGVGSSALGATHSWRTSMPDDFTDHNWPKTSTNDRGLHHLPGGTEKHDNVLRCHVDKLRMNPILSRSASYSLSKASRFGKSCHEDGSLNKAEAQKQGTLGPGAYCKSAPRGTAFSTDGGETVVLGANHTCPWKKALGHHINPVDVDLTSHPSAPAFSFSKTRRTISETSVGHAGGPVKTDMGCLGPGPIYEHVSSLQPCEDVSLNEKRKRRLGSSGSVSRVRSIPMPPEEPPLSSEAAGEPPLES